MKQAVSEPGEWAPAGFKAQYRRLAKDGARPLVLRDLLSLVGYSATVAQIVAWPLRARIEAEAFAVNVHLLASDNILRSHPRPKWFPNAWEGKPAGDGIFATPGLTSLPNPVWE